MSIVVILEMLMPAILGLMGALIGQIGLVCYQVLPCEETEKEKPVFKKENFKNEYNLWYALPTAILFPLLFVKYGISLEFVLYSIIGSILVPILAIDFKHCIIPDKLNLFGIVTGVIYVIALLILGNTALAINHILGGLIGGGIFLLLALISLLVYKQEGMGFGDIKLMTVLGLAFGIKGILVLTLIAFVIGAIVCITLLVSKKKSMKDYIPFGPYICLAAYVLMFVPAGFFVDWYFNLLFR